MFYKLTLVCFDVWANEMAPKLQGLSRFKEKFDVLKSARVEFPKDRRQYNEGLSYILESLGDLEISLCDFTQDISDLPSRIESSTLNISTGQYDPILPQSQVPKIPIESSKSGQKTTSINQQPAITQSSFSKPGLSYVAAPINEVLESQECSEIVAEQSKIDTDRVDDMYDFDKHKEDNKGSNAKRLLEHKDDEIQRFRDTVEHLEKLLREANDDKRAKDMKIERLRKSNEELLKDVEELTDENTKLLGKVKLLVNEEGRLRDQLQAHSQTEIELKNQLMKSFEAKANNKMTPEKEAHFDSAFKHIDNSSINVCPTCESLREDNKDLSRRLKTSQKELEMMNIRNEELLKQIRLMAISEEAIPERQEQRLQREITIETPSKSNTRLADDAALQKPKFSLQEEFLERTKFTDSKERREELSFRPTTSSPQLIEKDTPNTTNYGMRPDLAETLRSLKESKNKLENFQFKMQKQKEDWEALNTPFNPKPLGLQNRHSGFESKPYDAQRERQNPFDFSENSNFLKQQAPNTGDSILPKKRDFSLPRATELNEKLTSLLGGHINDKAGQSSREDQGRSVFNYFKANHSEGFKNYDQFSGLGYNEKGRGSNIGRQREALMFKDLEALEKLEKDDISKLRPRREERLLSTLDDRIKADRSVDFGGREPNRYLTSEDPSTRGDFQKKQRKSIGHAPQSRYLERLSKLYEGEEGQTSASITQDLSFVSNRRMSSSQDRTVLAGQDGFLRQINDRINSLVTK